MKNLDNLTICIIDCRSYAQALFSLTKSREQVNPARVIFFTDADIPPQAGIDIIKIESIRSKEAYSKWVMTELYKYITTTHILIQQWDSWILDGDQWNDDYLSVDYIGASWIETDGFSVGNGGFSLRARRLMEAVATDPIIVSYHPEDNMIC